MGKTGWGNRIRDMGLAKKLILTYCILLILPLGISSYLTFHSYSASLQENVGKYESEVVQQLTFNLDTYLNELDKLTITAYQSKEILAFLETPRKPGEPLPLPVINALDNYVTTYFLTGRVDVRGVSLFGEKGASFSALAENPYDYTAQLSDYPDLAAKMKQQAGSTTYYRTHTVQTNRGTTYQVFSIGRQIKNLVTGKPIGYLFLDVDLTIIRSMAAQVSLGDGENIMIVDESGKPVFQKRPGPIPREIATRYRGSGTARITLDGEEQLLAYFTSAKTGWTTFGMVPLDSLLQDIRVVRNSILLVGSFCVGLALLVSVFFAWQITRPIRKLRALMKQVELGDLDVFFPVRSSDEIGQLGRAFNLMVSRISQLGFRLYELEIREKDAQIAALQSQINPHFLYNTLGSIAMFAEVQGNQEVVQMTHNLSKLLRYSINVRKEPVTLREEVQHVREYIAIQQIRFEERIRFHLEIEEELYDCPMIQLILQPIVENAISNGIEQGSGSGTISLTGRRDGHLLVLTIADDGSGMTGEKLAELRNRMETGSRPDGASGHGLVNVHRRLLLHYGPGHGLEISSAAGRGTTVTIRLPMAAAEGGEPLSLPS